MCKEPEFDRNKWAPTLPPSWVQTEDEWLAWEETMLMSGPVTDKNGNIIWTPPEEAGWPRMYLGEYLTLTDMWYNKHNR